MLDYVINYKWTCLRQDLEKIRARIAVGFYQDCWPIKECYICNNMRFKGFSCNKYSINDAIDSVKVFDYESRIFLYRLFLDFIYPGNTCADEYLYDMLKTWNNCRSTTQVLVLSKIDNIIQHIDETEYPWMKKWKDKYGMISTLPSEHLTIDEQAELFEDTSLDEPIKI